MMRTRRKIIRINEDKCTGCGLCVPSCAEGAIRIVSGKARIVAEKYCDGLGACLRECPEGALSIQDVEADAFDPEAVEKHSAAAKTATGRPRDPARFCSCPSMMMEVFPTDPASHQSDQPAVREDSPAALTHWPVQIRLVPPTAPFLKDADILVAADCTPVAYAHFHDDFLAGRVVLIGCPKFDDSEAYAERFAQIFQVNDVTSVTVLVMDVPCCQGLPILVQRGMERSGRNIPLNKITISRHGTIL
jgi:Pyruvate/2-oxoacid:ferredoxin oxidoreductase delta subunit